MTRKTKTDPITSTFTLGGKEYTPHYGTNAICDIEEKTGKSIFKFLQDISKPGNQDFRTLKTLVLCGLPPSERTIGTVGSDFPADEIMKATPVALASLINAFEGLKS